MASIELHCTICPSKPSFSDQSHLLTHIGSKGHLSHYFKSQVRARQDPDTRDRLQQYDTWYAQNNIEELLSQRLKAKDNKNAPRRALPTRKSPVPKKRASRKKAAAQVQIHSDYDLQAGPVIDPSLESHLPMLPTPQALGQSGRVSPRPYDTRSRRAPVAHMSAASPHSKNTLIPLGRGHQTSSHGMQRYGLRANHEQSFHPLTPTVHASQHEPSPLRLQSSPTESRATISVGSSGSPKTQLAKANYQPGDSAILKGIIWPGMNLFDTADEDSRRKRNQKKDASTLNQMKLESETFEPTEVIYFYPSWDLKRERFISGEVESSPPPELEEPTGPPPLGEQRAPLAELDTNVQGTKRVRTRKAAAAKSENRSFTSGFGDIDSDLELTLGNKRKKTGRGFDVFRDSPVKSEPMHETDNEQSGSANLFEQDGANRPAFESGGYFDHVYEPQPLSNEHVSFLEGGSIYDRPSLTTSHVRGSSVFRVDGQHSQNQTLASNSRGYSSVMDPNQRFFTSENQDNNFRTSMPSHMDMTIAFGSQHSPNPFQTGPYGGFDVFGAAYGNVFNQQARQDPPIDFRQAPRYTTARKSPPSEGTSSEATIDQGISEPSFFDN